MVRELISMGLCSSAAGLKVLDQTLLPWQEKWIHIENPQHMVQVIQKLQIRGAPLIGVGAAMALAHFAHQGASVEALLEARGQLRVARPTAVNLMQAMDFLEPYLESYNKINFIYICEQYFLEDQALCQKIAKHGADLIHDGDHILTHCNSGGLATAGWGTALGVIRQAWQDGKTIHVYVDETRPLLQGARLTTWELKHLGIPHTLICDNMAAMMMAQGRIHKIFVGADRIARNGDFANKIGTYGLAVLASYHKVPFYVVAPSTTIDLNCLNGEAIPLEERAPHEVRGMQGHFGSVEWAPSTSFVYNPAFDCTPAGLVQGWILDQGVYHQDQWTQLFL